MASNLQGAGLVGWISSALREGVSQRATMSTLRESGFKFSDAKFRSLWGEVRAGMDVVERAAGLRTDTLPRDEDYSPWSTTRGRGFATHLQYARREIGTDEVTMTDYLHITDEPHSIDDAINALHARMAEPEGAEQEYDFEILGAVATGVYRIGPL